MKTNNLDKASVYARLDKREVGRSIELLPDQIRQALDDSLLIKVPREYSQVSEVVVNGMGGSNLGAYLVKELFMDRLKAPVLIEPGYRVPAYADKNTLYVLSSYSGTTEEPLSTYREAKKRGAKILAITSDSPKSRLLKLMLKDDIPGYVFKPQYNPCGEPRIGLGYAIFGLMALLARAGLFEIKVKEIENVIARLEIWTRELRTDVPVARNAAKRLALELRGRTPVLVGAEFLAGNLNALRNQFNESAKTFASLLRIPDLNHYAMEGLAFPATNKKEKTFLFFDSAFYHPRVQRRGALTKEVVKKNGIKVLDYELKGKDKLTQSFELLQLGTWITYYLGILNGVDPVKIPYVDWFKRQLK